MDHQPQGNDLLRALKARAGELRAQARAAGESMKHSAALEAAARERGFRDWNAAAAACKASPAMRERRPLWRDIDQGLPQLPMRFFKRASRFYDSIEELMRRAKQYELIARNASKDARREMLGLIGGSVPYVFVQDVSRWSDDLFRLCDRGYQPWPGIAFTHEELVTAGVDQWEAEYGAHSGSDMYSVANDDVTLTNDADMLKRLARLCAGIALVADAAYERQAGEVLPEGAGFKIDLKDPAQLTAASVARLIASRDDSQHRQLRVTKDGVAYLSDVVGNIDTEGLAFRLPTWVQGSGYVGIDAAQDPEWVASVLQDLRKNWPKPKSELIDW
jgi:hypothetical protein